MVNVMLVGGAGYVGSHCAKYLAGRGVQPVVYDNLSRGHASAVRWGPLLEGDLADTATLIAALRSHRPAAVMHFAALAYVGESVTSPAPYYRNNVCGTLSLLEAMRETGVNRLIFSSTCATYGVPASLPIEESAPQRPVNPYGRSKLMAEQILADFDAAYGLPHVNLRYFNAAGADPEGEIGEDHRPETHLIPLAIEAALGRRRCLTVFGDDYPTDDGTCLRDYVHVTDLAQAHWLALGRLLERGGSASYNLGNGGGHTVRQVVEAVAGCAGREVPVEVAARRPGNPPALVGGSEKARSDLGWRPEFPGLDGIVETAWRWHSREDR